MLSNSGRSSTDDVEYKYDSNHVGFPIEFLIDTAFDREEQIDKEP